MNKDLLCVRTRDLTFTFMAAINSSQMEQLHSVHLVPDAVAAGTGTRSTAMSQAVVVLSENREGNHHSIVYIALATTMSIYILDVRIKVQHSPIKCHSID